MVTMFQAGQILQQPGGPFGGRRINWLSSGSALAELLMSFVSSLLVQEVKVLMQVEEREEEVMLRTIVRLMLGKTLLWLLWVEKT